MNPFEDLGKMLIFFGLLIIVIGLLFVFGSKLPFPLGKLPGDIVIKRGNFTFYFPLVTCIVLSILLSIILSLFFRR